MINNQGGIGAQVTPFYFVLRCFAIGIIKMITLGPFKFNVTTISEMVYFMASSIFMRSNMDFQLSIRFGSVINCRKNTIIIFAPTSAAVSCAIFPIIVLRCKAVMPWTASIVKKLRSLLLLMY